MYGPKEWARDNAMEFLQKREEEARHFFFANSLPLAAAPTLDRFLTLNGFAWGRRGERR